ncbi:MAG TPA: NAD(P)/FAD-dependent oxidoreductase [Rhizomicrobium sp.]|nr:NAD(P)/FAD-dependent oxidoreductase [Rhizomicrobium sp.]
MTDQPIAPSRRSLLSMIGVVAGSAAMYHAMTELGYAGESTFKGPIKLSPPPNGTSVLVLGAGVAGMVAAMELRDAGYKVQVLEYNGRPGGRNWTLYGGDTYTELGGLTQKVGFDPGQYINPGPWRIPYHHQGILHYINRLGVALEPFTQVNFNAYVHSTEANGGKPLRYREVQADFHGHVAELLGKCTRQGALDQLVTKEDREILLAALQDWGALDGNYDYSKGLVSSNRRGYEVDAGGGLKSLPVPSEPKALHEVLTSQMWAAIGAGCNYEMQSAIFQPKGGMGMIGAAMGKELGPLIQYNCKVIDIHQDDKGVTATYVDSRNGATKRTARADWCVCTIPASVLSQIPMNVGAPMKNAINQLPYQAALKVGLQFKRRFWEQDDQIYGGHSYTNQPNSIIGYPMWDYFSKGKGVLLGAYTFGQPAFLAAAKPPEERIQDALEYGSKIHPQYKTEYECGVAVAWHRVPWTLGCAGAWTDAGRDTHYDNLCALDGRIVLAGEHASRIPAWQEGAVTSALDAIGRLHKRVMSA